MRQIGEQQQDIKYTKMFYLKVVLMLPPEPETEEEKRYAECEIVESHVEEVVVCKRKTEPSVHKPILFFFVNSIKEIEKRDRDHPDCDC